MADFPVDCGSSNTLRNTVEICPRSSSLSYCSSFQLMIVFSMSSNVLDRFLTVGDPCLSSIWQPYKKLASQLH